MVREVPSGGARKGKAGCRVRQAWDGGEECHGVGGRVLAVTVQGGQTLRDKHLVSSRRLEAMTGKGKAPGGRAGVQF